MTLIHVFVFRLTNTRLLPKQRHFHFESVEDAAEVVLQVKFTSNTRNPMQSNSIALQFVQSNVFTLKLYYLFL